MVKKKAISESTFEILKFILQPLFKYNDECHKFIAVYENLITIEEHDIVFSIYRDKIYACFDRFTSYDKIKNTNKFEISDFIIDIIKNK